jgi:hypothetical protein
MVASTLSHLAATVATDRPPPPADALAHAQALAGAQPVAPAQEVSPQTFSQVRSALIKALRTSPDAREPLCDALELLETIQAQLEHYRSAMPPAPPATRAARSPRAKLQEYRIQKSADGEFLSERRPGHSQPFRCPRATYDAAAAVLAESQHALHFDELMERLNARMGERQPDYRLRVALRFWLAGNAILRSRTKYTAGDRRTFVETTGRLWDDLAAAAK